MRRPGAQRRRSYGDVPRPGYQALIRSHWVTFRHGGGVLIERGAGGGADDCSHGVISNTCKLYRPCPLPGHHCHHLILLISHIGTSTRAKASSTSTTAYSSNIWLIIFEYVFPCICLLLWAETHTMKYVCSLMCIFKLSSYVMKTHIY